MFKASFMWKLWMEAEGAAALVKAARVAVNRRFPNTRNKPNLLFTDKGKGFYYSNSAPTKEYAKALKDHRFKIAVGTDAPLQPGNFGDVLLHETAIAWLRLRLKQTVRIGAGAVLREALR